MRTGVVVQARLGSKRFPGKVLADLCGKSVLQHVLDRCGEIGPEVILATPDRELEGYGGTPTVLGAEGDVLERYLCAANAYNLDIIMRITADCPLLRADLCRDTLDVFNKTGCKYAAVDWPRTFPRGWGCEVFSRGALGLAHEAATEPHDREHVTPWMQRWLNCVYLTQEVDESHLNYCVDVPEDLPRLRAILEAGAEINWRL